MAEIQVNQRGIPMAPFVEKVETFVQPGESEATLSKFQEMVSKYKFMETHLLQRKSSLESKIPEITKTLEMVQFLESQDQTLNTQFELGDTLWANASIPPCQNVNLWLGANVMLEYPIAEAKNLLADKLSSAKVSLKQVNEDLSFIKDQVTTMEVNIARVYNYDVKIRRSKK
jgi:prefoldin subunit 5